MAYCRLCVRSGGVGGPLPDNLPLPPLITGLGAVPPLPPSQHATVGPFSFDTSELSRVFGDLNLTFLASAQVLLGAGLLALGGLLLLSQTQSGAAIARGTKKAAITAAMVIPK